MIFLSQVFYSSLGGLFFFLLVHSESVSFTQGFYPQEAILLHKATHLIWPHVFSSKGWTEGNTSSTATGSKENRPEVDGTTETHEEI